MATTLALLSIQQAAALANTSERHIRNLIYRREIPYVKVGRYVRFRLKDLEAWIEANTVPAS